MNKFFCMRDIGIFAAGAVLALGIAQGSGAFAQDTAAQEQTSRPDAARVEIDQDAKAFLFVIDDEPVAMIDKDGLHVPGEINYGRYLTDTGPEAVKNRIETRGEGGSE